MANLFDYGDVKNHPRRSGFDLSKRFLFTAKVGELLPVYWRLTYPGDKFKLGVQHFTRTMPVNTAAFTRIREYYDWYWVPLRLINKNIGQALVNMTDNPVQASGLQSARQVVQDIPYTKIGSIKSSAFSPSSISFLLAVSGGYYSSTPDYAAIKNQFGFGVSAASAKLLKYLGYGALFPVDYTPSSPSIKGLYGLTTNTELDEYDVRAVDDDVNLLPLLAYQKIYADYFRFQQWENNEPWTYNADYYNGGNFFASLASMGHAYTYMSSNNILTLRYANWKKDLFMGIMPNSQLGDIATVQTSGVNSSRAYAAMKFMTSPSAPSTDASVTASKAQPAAGALTLAAGASTTTEGQLVIRESDLNLGSMSFNILQLRMSEALQRYREVAQCSDQTYRDQIQAHFGVNLSAALSDKCMWIGGHVSNLNIDDVVNTNLTEGDTDIKGKGVASGQGFENFSCDEHGVLMCIYHAEPLLEYVRSGNRRELLYTDTTDLPFPEFDSIGMESVSYAELFNSASLLDSSNVPLLTQAMGYAPRYYELKTDIDEVCGAFTTTLQQWVAPINPAYLTDWLQKVWTASSNILSVNMNWFKINPSILDNIFIQKADSTWDSDQLWIAAYFDIRAVRNFDYDGMPY